MDLPLLIFTDLDGTLLDHHTYSFQGAAATLQKLREYSVPLIFASSKTRAEMSRLRERLGLHEPFISENGGGIFFPPGHALQDVAGCTRFNGDCGIVFAKSYAFVRRVFVRLRRKYNIKGFGDMTTAEIMRHTGLSREEAELAGQRDFSEPFLFLGEERPGEMGVDATPSGLAVTRGGRFYHLIDAGQDKGRAVAETTRLFRSAEGERRITVGLGDAPNDFSMLRAVDIPVLIPGPDGIPADVEMPGLRIAPLPGSKGWGMILAEILAAMVQKTPGGMNGGTDNRVDTVNR